MTPLHRLSAVACFTLLTAGCVAGYAGDGGGYDGTAGFDAGYYEPYGVDYGGWGSGYEVGPYYDGGGRYRGGGRGDDHGGRAAQHAYRSAPSSHAMPSIPSGPRGGGAHGGGGGANGGGGRSR